MKRLPIRNSGQALLVILLIMAVALTIGLAVTSRTVTDVEISGKTEEAARAFSAAEAGIEEALVGIGTTTFGGGFSEGVSYTTKRDFLGASSQFLFPEATKADEARTLWLAKYDDLSKAYHKTQLHLLWGNPGEISALEASLYYLNESSDEYKVARFLLDPNEGRDNNFCKPSGANCEYISTTVSNYVAGFGTSGYELEGQTLQYEAYLRLGTFEQGSAGIVGLGVPTRLLFVRLRILYADEVQALGAKTAGLTLPVGYENFPSQGIKIESVGEAGGSTRKVEVIRMHPAPPGIFDFLLYSGGDLSK